MIRIIFVIVIAYLVSWLLMSGKAEEDILQAEIAEKNRILEESIWPAGNLSDEDFSSDDTSIEVVSTEGDSIE